MDTEKQRYCVEKRFWKTRGIGWSNMLKENMVDTPASQTPLRPENVWTGARRPSARSRRLRRRRFRSDALGGSPEVPELTPGEVRQTGVGGKKRKSRQRR